MNSILFNINNVEFPKSLDIFIKFQKDLENYFDNNANFEISNYNLILTTNFFRKEILKYLKIRNFKAKIVIDLIIQCIHVDPTLKFYLLNLKKKNTICYVLRKLYENKIIFESEIYNIINLNENLLFNCYFNFLLIKDDLKSYKYDEIFGNNERSKIEELIEFGTEKNSFYYSIKYDDIHLFEKIIFNDEENLILNLDISSFELSKIPIIKDPFGLSIHFGSLNIFKYLLLCKNFDFKTYINNAIYSDNLEILFFFKNYEYLTENCFLKVIEFRKTSIIEWIIEYTQNKYLNLNNIIKFKYIRLILFILQNYHSKIIDNYLLNYLIDFIELRNIFLEFGYNINYIYLKNNLSLLHHSILKNNINDVIYLINNNVDINLNLIQYSTPLNFSLEMKNFEII